MLSGILACACSPSFACVCAITCPGRGAAVLALVLFRCTQSAACLARANLAPMVSCTRSDVSWRRVNRFRSCAAWRKQFGSAAERLLRRGTSAMSPRRSGSRDVGWRERERMGLSFTFQRVEDLNSDASSVFVVLVLSSSEFVNVSIFELTAESLGGH